MSGDFHDANYNVTKIRTEDGEVAELELALKRTKLLFTHTASTSYLEKLTAESSLLNAQLSLTNDKFERIQAAINLYAALGGGRE